MATYTLLNDAFIGGAVHKNGTTVELSDEEAKGYLERGTVRAGGETVVTQKEEATTDPSPLPLSQSDGVPDGVQPVPSDPPTLTPEQVAQDVASVESQDDSAPLQDIQIS